MTKFSTKHYLEKLRKVLCIHTLYSRTVDNTEDAHFWLSRVQLDTQLFGDIAPRQWVTCVRRFVTSWWKLDTQALNMKPPRFAEKSGTDYVVIMMMMIIIKIIIII